MPGPFATNGAVLGTCVAPKFLANVSPKILEPRAITGTTRRDPMTGAVLQPIRPEDLGILLRSDLDWEYLPDPSCLARSALRAEPAHLRSINRLPRAKARRAHSGAA